MSSRRKSEDDYERQTALHWHAAAMNAQARFGKLPDLKTVLAKLKRGNGPQGRNEQRAVMGQLAARMGKSITKTRLVKTT